MFNNPLDNNNNTIVRFIERTYGFDLDDYEKITARRYLKVNRQGRIDLKNRDTNDISYRDDNIRLFLRRNRTNVVTDKDINIIKELQYFRYNDRSLGANSINKRNDIFVNIITRKLNPITPDDTARLTRVITGLRNERLVRNRVEGLFGLEDDEVFISRINNNYVNVDNMRQLKRQLYLFSPIDFIDSDDNLVEHKTISSRQTFNEMREEMRRDNSIRTIPLDNLQKLIFHMLVKEEDNNFIVISQDRQDNLIRHSVNFSFQDENRLRRFNEIKNNLQNTINPILNNSYRENEELTNLFINEFEEQRDNAEERDENYIYGVIYKGRGDRGHSNNYNIAIDLTEFEDI